MSDKLSFLKHATLTTGWTWALKHDFISLELFFQTIADDTGLEIKKNVRLPFGNQLEKYSRQMQIFSRRFL